LTQQVHSFRVNRIARQRRHPERVGRVSPHEED
jgi:hypothetical protein